MVKEQEKGLPLQKQKKKKRKKKEREKEKEREKRFPFDDFFLSSLFFFLSLASPRFSFFLVQKSASAAVGSLKVVRTQSRPSHSGNLVNQSNLRVNLSFLLSTYISSLSAEAPTFVLRYSPVAKWKKNSNQTRGENQAKFQKPSKNKKKKKKQKKKKKNLQHFQPG